MIICAALAEGESHLSGIAQSDDILATLDCIKALGADCKLCENGLTVFGGIKSAENKSFPCRESASTLRFFIPLALLGSGQNSFTGSARLIERGADLYEKVLGNVSFEKHADGITADGQLVAGNYRIQGNISSQYISGLLLALPLLSESSTLEIIPPVESRSYIDMTVDVMKMFGVTVEENENKFFIKGNQKYKNGNFSVEGDWSNAAVFYALNFLGNNIEINGLNKNSIQGDRICVELLERLDGENPIIDVSDCPDLAPVLFAAAAAKHGAVFTGTKRLKIKESDRAEAMAEELAKFGINVSVEKNRVTVFGGKLKAPIQTLNGHSDHRIVMALSMLLTLTGGTLDGAESISKSYPDFFENLEKLRADITYKSEAVL